MSAVVNSLNIGAVASQAKTVIRHYKFVGMNLSGRGFLVTVPFVM